MKSKHYSRRIDFIVVVTLTIIPIILTNLLQLNFISAVFLYFGIPSLYLSFRQPGSVRKVLIFSAILCTAGTLMDYLTAVNNSFFVPTIFSFRIFGVVPVEDIVYGFLLIYYLIMFYEHFIDYKKHINQTTRFKSLIILILAFLVIFLITLTVAPELLKLPNFYFIGGLLGLFLPPILFIFFHPKLTKRYLEIGFYFFIINLLVELTALRLNHWTFFNSVATGYIELAGYKLSFEEFFFFICMGSMAILTYFEYFDNENMR